MVIDCNTVEFDHLEAEQQELRLHTATTTNKELPIEERTDHLRGDLK